jgi:hypothetical protein
LTGGLRRKEFAIMSPEYKLPNNKPESKENNHFPACPYCGFIRCWKHGAYERKGFHMPSSEPQHGTVVVQRYQCRQPSCGHTFSILPEEVLPYCRFFWNGLLQIAATLTEGKSAYWIAKYQWCLSLRVILRAVGLIQRVTPWLEQRYREATGSIETGIQALAQAVRKTMSWFSFTRYWFHGFYPCRAGHIYNPHNLGIKRL